MAQRFGIQYNRLIDAAQDYAADEPCRSGLSREPVTLKMNGTLYPVLIGPRALATDNKVLKKQLNAAKEELNTLSC